MFDFCFDRWMHVEAARSHKSAYLKERSYVPSHARRSDSNICMLEVSTQPYFVGFREILSVLSDPGCCQTA